MNDKTLEIVIAAAACVWVLLSAVGLIYFGRSSAEQRRKAGEKFQELIDKSVEASDDPNEPARFVP
jgi:hypothetical protein